MANTKVLQQSFNGGIISDEMLGRFDDVKRTNGVSELKNFIVTPQGPITKRTGTAFVREVEDSDDNCIIIPFIYSIDQSFVIEISNSYFRFHTNGATLMIPDLGDIPTWDSLTSYEAGDFVIKSGTVYQAKEDNVNQDPAVGSGSGGYVWNIMPSSGIYQIKSEYFGLDLNKINFVQSNDVVTLVHPDSPPYELKRMSESFWRFDNVINDSLDALIPDSPEIDTARSVGSGDTVYRYKVTSVNSDSEESLPSGEMLGNAWTIDIVTSGAATTVSTVLDNDFKVGQRISISGVGSDMNFVEGDFEVYAISTSKIFTISQNGVPYNTTGAGTSGSGGTARAYGYVNDLLTTGNKNVFTWTAVSGAAKYKVYKESSGQFGFVGETELPFFIDDNIAADIARTPPIDRDILNAANDFPRAVTYHEQRRVFAGSNNAPQTVWMTRTGTEADFNYHIPVLDDDSIVFRVASRENNAIQHLVPLGDLLLLTNAAEWKLYGQGSVITPTTLSVNPQSYIGCNGVQPVTINTTALFAEGTGGHVREIAYNWQSGGYATRDLSIRSPHLFENKSIVDMAYSKSPIPVVWFVNGDGELLGLTYMPDQEVFAWHQHDTDGLFESVCCVPENGQSVLYAIVQREIDGNTVRYIERFAERFAGVTADAFFVDCGATYDGAATTTITGLDFIEGKTVAILADGAIHPQKTVTGGEITLDYEASKVQVGLPIVSTLKTLPVAIQVEAYGMGRNKNINKAIARVKDASGLYFGYDEDHLVEYKQRSTEVYGSPPNLISGEIELNVTGNWNKSGQICVRQSSPLPSTIISLTLELSIG